MATKKQQDMVAAMLAAIKESGMTDYALAQASGVPASTIGRFTKGERDITLATAAKLATVLGLKLTGEGK